MSKLQGKDDYSPLFLTDSMVGIDNYAEVFTNDDFVTPVLRARYRAQFCTELSYGVETMRITQNPGCICVWKVPNVDRDHHVGLVVKAINDCTEMTPKQVSTESVRHFNVIMSGVTAFPCKSRNAI
eukprot:3110682-Ditylum_brightwellii.AAC.1